MRMGRRRKWAMAALAAWMVAIFIGEFIMGKPRFSEVFPPYLVMPIGFAIAIFFWTSPRYEQER
jgi:hypothetical protein